MVEVNAPWPPPSRTQTIGMALAVLLEHGSERIQCPIHHVGVAAIEEDEQRAQLVHGAEDSVQTWKNKITLRIGANLTNFRRVHLPHDCLDFEPPERTDPEECVERVQAGGGRVNGLMVRDLDRAHEPFARPI